MSDICSLLKTARKQQQVLNYAHVHMYIHVHVCTFVSRTSESELKNKLIYIACSNINTDGYSLILHALDCTILCVHTVEHTKRVEKLQKNCYQA